MAKITLIIRYVLALVFLASGVSKLFSPQEAAIFFSEITSVGNSTSQVFVIVLSIIECLLAILLLSGKILQGASLISAFFFLTAFVMGGLNAGADTSCGCFGGLIESKVNEWFFARNFIFLGFSMFILNRLKNNGVPA